MARGNFEGVGQPIVKYRDTLRSSVQTRLNRSKCHLGCGLGWAQGIVVDEAHFPHGKRQFWGGKGWPIVKYRDTLTLAVQKRLNRSRCHLGYWVGWTKEPRIRWGYRSPMQSGNFEGKGHSLRCLTTLWCKVCKISWINWDVVCDAALCQITLITCWGCYSETDQWNWHK